MVLVSTRARTVRARLFKDLLGDGKEIRRGKKRYRQQIPLALQQPLEAIPLALQQQCHTVGIAAAGKQIEADRSSKQIERGCQRTCQQRHRGMGGMEDRKTHVFMPCLHMRRQGAGCASEKMEGSKACTICLLICRQMQRAEGHAPGHVRRLPASQAERVPLVKRCGGGGGGGRKDV